MSPLAHGSSSPRRPRGLGQGPADDESHAGAGSSLTSSKRQRVNPGTSLASPTGPRARPSRHPSPRGAVPGIHSLTLRACKGERDGGQPADPGSASLRRGGLSIVLAGRLPHLVLELPEDVELG